MSFLRNYVQHKDFDLCQFVYLNRIWVFLNGTTLFSWQHDDTKSVKTMKAEEKRYLIIHGGRANGFVEGDKLALSSATENAYYYGEMVRQLYAIVKKKN